MKNIQYKILKQDVVKLIQDNEFYLFKDLESQCLEYFGGRKDQLKIDLNNILYELKQDISFDFTRHGLRILWVGEGNTDAN